MGSEWKWPGGRFGTRGAVGMRSRASGIARPQNLNKEQI